MSDSSIEQLKAALRDVLLEQDELRQRLAAMREQLAALQALSRDLQADAPPDATPWQQADGWEGKRAPVTKPPTAESI